MGDGVSQAADFISAVSSISSLNFTPSMTLQLVLTAQSPPGLRRRHHQFEHHEARGVLRQRALHADGAYVSPSRTRSLLDSRFANGPNDRRDPAALEIRQLKFSGDNIVKNLGQGDFGRIRKVLYPEISLAFVAVAPFYQHFNAA